MLREALEPFIESPASEEAREMREEYGIVAEGSLEARETIRARREQRQQAEARKQAEAAKTFPLRVGQSFTLLHAGDRLRVTLTYASSGYIGWLVQLGRCQPFRVGSGADRPGRDQGYSLALGVGEVEVSLRATAMPGGAMVTLDTEAEVTR